LSHFSVSNTILYSLSSHNFLEIILNAVPRDKQAVFIPRPNSPSFPTLSDLARIIAFFISLKSIPTQRSAIVILSEKRLIAISIPISTLASIELSMSSANA
jgi:hypothetical protein